MQCLTSRDILTVDDTGYRNIAMLCILKLIEQYLVFGVAYIGSIVESRGILLSDTATMMTY